MAGSWRLWTAALDVGAVVLGSARQLALSRDAHTSKSMRAATRGQQASPKSGLYLFAGWIECGHPHPRRQSPGGGA